MYDQEIEHDIIANYVCNHCKCYNILIDYSAFSLGGVQAREGVDEVKEWSEGSCQSDFRTC